MKKAYLLFILALFTIYSTNLSYAKNKNVLLQAPPEISEEVINGTIAQTVLNKEMTWISCFNSKSSCVRFSIAFGANCDSSFQLVLTGNKFIDELVEEEVSLFTRKANTWVYRYGNTIGKKQKKVKSTMFAQPLIITQATPAKLSILEISRLINDKNIIFYTGAGISSLVVPDMSELMTQLRIPNGSIDKFAHIIKFIRRTLKKPDKVIKTINGFKDACLYSDPTPAHFAIKDIALFKNWQILTENIDLLHQRSGIGPLSRANFHWLKKNINPKYLKQIDFIIVVGLHSDEVGLLALYKKHNPKGKIIAMNLVQPEYLGNDDIFLSGDAQKTSLDLFGSLSQVA